MNALPARPLIEVRESSLSNIVAVTRRMQHIQIEKEKLTFLSEIPSAFSKYVGISTKKSTKLIAAPM